MKTNSLLTYLLYALLATLIIAAGYKACQMQREKQREAQEQAEWQEQVNKMYPERDSSGGSAYIGNGQTGTSANGIEDEPVKPSTNAGNNTQSTTPPVTATPPVKETPKTTPPATTPSTSKPPVVAGPGTGRWEVRAGTFQYMAGARTRLEQVIKMGYTNAEIVKTSNGWAAVVVLRTNDRTRAIQVTDQLEKRGVDAGIFKR
ncbi:MAG: hypothetical protein H6565_07740 [Lewinellaceae bacterium]|nr:hypothetical protein [Lewinellaceae bacterium]